MKAGRILSLLQRLPVTLALTGVTTAVFLLELWMGGGTMPVLHRMGALNVERIVDHGEGWRLITPIFLHLNWLHFGLNTFALIQLAALTEILFGSHRLMSFYLVCGLVASLASALFGPAWMLGGIGASGALFGLVGLIMGTAIYGAPHWREQLRRPLRSLVFTVGLGVALAVVELLFGTRLIDHFAHLGGFLAGLLLAAAYPDPAAPTGRGEQVLAWAALGAMISAGGAAYFTGERALETLPDQAIRSAELRVEVAGGPIGQAMAATAGLEAMRELGVEDRETPGRQLIAKLSPEGLLWAVQLMYGTEERDDEVLWLAERWVAIAPEESNARNVLAWVLVTHGDEDRRDPTRSLSEIDRALELLPGDEAVGDELRPGARAAYLDTRAEALYQLGRLQEALSDQREAVELGEAEDVGEIDAMRERLSRIEAALGS